MHDIKIGTMISAPDVKEVMPKLIPYGFETFSITFWETTKGWDLEQLAKDIQEILYGTGHRFCRKGAGSSRARVNPGIQRDLWRVCQTRGTKGRKARF